MKGEKTMGRTIRELRAGRRMTQADLAKALGVNKMYVLIWESMDDKLIKKIANVFGVSPNEVQVPARYDR